MKLSLSTIKYIEEDIEKEVEQRVVNYPIYVFVDSQKVDVDRWDISNGEINIYLQTPFCAVK